MIGPWPTWEQGQLCRKSLKASSYEQNFYYFFKLIGGHNSSGPRTDHLWNPAFDLQKIIFCRFVSLFSYLPVVFGLGAVLAAPRGLAQPPGQTIHFLSFYLPMQILKFFNRWIKWIDFCEIYLNTVKIKLIKVMPVRDIRNQVSPSRCLRHTFD